MLNDIRIAFVGSGVMAEAMVKGLIGQSGVPGDLMTASGPRAERGEELKARYGVRWTTDNVAAIHSRVQDVRIRPDSWAALLRTWRIPSDRLIDRDRVGR